MDEALRRQYLEAMGIQCWDARSAASETAPEPVVEPSSSAPRTGDEPPSSSKDATPPVKPVSEEKPSARSIVPTGPVPEKRPAVAVASRDAVPVPDVPDMPPWLLDEPPLSEDFVPAAEPVDFPADLEPAIPRYDDLSGLDLEGLARRVAQCERCELHKTRTQTVFGVGNPEAELMVIGEAPGVEEDRQGEPFVGPAGQQLNAMLRAIGLQREQVFIANILKCHPPGNRDPHAEEALQCEPYLRRQIELLKPKVILCVGRVAAQNLLKSDDALGRMRGKALFFDQIPVVVTYHPAYLLRTPDYKARAWVDLQRVWRQLGLGASAGQG